MSEKKKLDGNDLKKAVSDSKKLDDSALEKVSGGFVETLGYAKAHEIMCPVCHNAAESNFAWWEETSFKQNGYTCENCGTSFWVDAYGYYYDAANNMLPFVAD